MKKVLTFVLAALMVAALAVPAFAAVEKIGAKSDKITTTIPGISEKAPVLDGKISEYEYQEIKYTVDDMRYKATDDAYMATVTKLGFKMYSAYTKDTLYVAVVVDTPNYTMTQAKNKMYNEYSCQISGGQTTGTGVKDRFEYIFGRTSTDNKLQFHAHGDFYNAKWEADLTGKDFVIVTNKDVTTYEMAIPAKAFGLTSFNKGDKIRLNVCMNVGSNAVGDKKNGQIEWSQGCGGSKDANKFAIVTLGDAIKIPAATTTAPATTTPTSPSTADPAIMIMAATVASAAAAYVVAKKKH